MKRTEFVILLRRFYLILFSQLFTKSKKIMMHLKAFLTTFFISVRVRLFPANRKKKRNSEALLERQWSEQANYFCLAHCSSILIALKRNSSCPEFYIPTTFSSFWGQEGNKVVYCQRIWKLLQETDVFRSV